jgi:predicted AlkP superfamily phosphohydrolase/phosphomutase
MAHNSSARVVLIGLDMGDASLIEGWAREGVLPTLQSIMTEGFWGRLETTAEVLHTSSWPTIFTGTLPGKHGIYYPYQPHPGEQLARHIGPEQYGERPFWKILDDAGKRCVVLDAPETFPVNGFQGVQIFEWGTWAWYWKRMATPNEIEQELRKTFGPYPLRLEAKRLGLRMPKLDDLRKRLIASAIQKANITKWLMDSRPWDLFLVVFAELHPAGHYLWPRNALAPCGQMPGGADSSVSDLRDIYVAVDTAIGEILKVCGDEVTVWVTSGDGVGPNHSAWHLLPQALSRLGFRETTGNSNSHRGRYNRGGLLKRLRDSVPPEVRSVISSRLSWRLRDSLVSRLTTSDIDWSRTRAFTLPTDLEGCIRINLRGREPQGVVEPGSQYEEVCSELTESLENLVNPATGRPAVRHVWRIDHLFPGNRRDHLPDLTVVWNDEAEIRELYSDRTGLMSEPTVDPRTGTHHPLSFIAARGTRAQRGKIEGGHIVDIAPTVLSHFGIQPPAQMDGQVLGALQ